MKQFTFSKYSYLLILVVLTSLGCNRAPIYKSLAEENMKKEIQYIGFDNQSTIRYAISNDKDYLYIRLEALSRPSVIKIIQSGFYIYLDTLGKKEKDIWLNYPQGYTNEVFNAKLFDGDQQENAALIGKLDLESKIKDVGKFGVFAANEKEESVENNLEKGFAFNLVPGEYGSLNYYAAIRLDRIKKGGLENLEIINIGIVSGAFKKPNMPGGGHSGGQSSRYSGMNRVPTAQDQNNFDPQKFREMAIMSIPINFWIKVQLHKQ